MLANPPKTAFVTLLMINDSYLPGCLVTAYGLRQQRTLSDLVCLVTQDVSDTARNLLKELYDHVVEVAEIYPLSVNLGSRQALPRMFTRFAALRLGSDGDLGCGYERIITLDADLLPLCNFDDLWKLSSPAGVINERREYMAEFNPSGELVRPVEVADNYKWAWHKVYDSVCPHGTVIPKYITDRVATDYANYGVNGSLYLLETSQQEFDKFIGWLELPTNVEHIQKDWRWPDMQAATLFWSGRWTNIDVSYSTLYAFPSIKHARGLHFAGVKPWSWRKQGFDYRLRNFSDFQLWSGLFLKMMDNHSRLANHRPLRRLQHEIVSLDINQVQVYRTGNFPFTTTE